jgi:hypothetical protein
MKHLLEIVIRNHVPKILVLYFNEINYKTECTISKNHKGEDINIYYKTFPIIKLYNKDNIPFYCLEQYYETIDNYLKQGICFNKNNEKINNDDFEVFLNSYGNGFQDGYNNFEKVIKSSSVFELENEEKAYKIFRRIYDPQFQKKGEVNYDSEFKNNKTKDDVHKSIGVERNNLHESIEMVFEAPNLEIEKVIFDVDKFYESGYGGGEFYKAWELIFENRTIFEPLFIKYIEKNIEKTETQLQPTKTVTKNNFNPNYFNKKCYNLFLYLTENYIKKGKIHFINIFYFLKDFQKDGNGYIFNFTQKQYKKFILETYNVEIKKFGKAEQDFEQQKGILNSLEQQFRGK